MRQVYADMNPFQAALGGYHQDHNRATAQAIGEAAQKMMPDDTRRDPLGASGWWPVTVAGTDGGAVEHVAALPWWSVVGLVGHDHAFPAVLAQFTDLLDDAALAPPVANSDPHGGVARAGAPLLPGWRGRGCAHDALAGMKPGRRRV
jgi:hypothetical protein